MTEGLSRATAAPQEFNLGDKTLKLHPLRNMDWGEIEQWARSKVIQAATEAIAATLSLSDEQQQQIIRAACQEASQVSIAALMFESAQSKEVKPLKFISSFEGMLRIVQLSLRDKSGKDGRPLHSLNEVDELIGQNLDSLGRMFEIVFSLSFPEAEVETKKNQSPHSKT